VALKDSIFGPTGDECTFTVMETDDSLAEYFDKLDQRFVEGGE
jgi:hypothetical protein